MENVFKKSNENYSFAWENFGNIKEGRGELGEEMPILVYRLVMFTMYEILVRKSGEDFAKGCLRDGGYLAGSEFTHNELDTSLPPADFIHELQRKLEIYKIGVLHMESIDNDENEIVLTVSQDLNCSGFPITKETMRTYTEGFLEGAIETYTGKPYNVTGINCWVSGVRMCRFTINPK